MSRKLQAKIIKKLTSTCWKSDKDIKTMSLRQYLFKKEKKSNSNSNIKSWKTQGEFNHNFSNLENFLQTSLPGGASLVAQSVKNPTAMQETRVWIPGSGRSPGEGNGNLLQDSCLENPMDGEAWQAPVHGVMKSRTRLSDFTFTIPGGASGKEPACQSRKLKSPGLDPWVRKIPWRRKWRPTPVFSSGEPHGRRILVRYSP